jgi:hypothetical protein
MASRFMGQMGSSINSAGNSDFELEIEICELRGRRFRQNDVDVLLRGTLASHGILERVF